MTAARHVMPEYKLA